MWEINLERFNEVNDKYVVVINEIKAKISTLENQKQTMQAEWNELLLLEIEGEKHANIDTFQKKLASVINELNVQTSLLKTAEGRKRTALIELMPTIESARNEYHNDVYNEVIAMSDTLKRRRCDYLLACRDVNSVKAKGNEIEGQFNDCIRKAYGYVGDTCGYSKPRRKEYPAVNLHSDHKSIDEPCAPRTQETLVALNTGKLPLFVIWYEFTGELVSEIEARKLLAERKKKEETNNGK